MLIDFLKAIKAYAEKNQKNTVKGDNQFFIKTLDDAISSCLNNQTNLDKQHLEALSTYHKVIGQIILRDTTTRDLYINKKETLQNTLNTSDFIEMHKRLAVNLSWETKILSTNIIPTEGLHTTPNDAEESSEGLHTTFNDTEESSEGLHTTSNDAEESSEGLHTTSSDAEESSEGLHTTSNDAEESSEGSTNSPDLLALSDLFNDKRFSSLSEFCDYIIQIRNTLENNNSITQNPSLHNNLDITSGYTRLLGILNKIEQIDVNDDNIHTLNNNLNSLSDNNTLLSTVCNFAQVKTYLLLITENQANQETFKLLKDEVSSIKNKLTLHAYQLLKLLTELLTPQISGLNAEIIDTFEKLTPLVTKRYQDRLIEIKVNYLNTGNLNQLADQIKQFNQEFKQDRTAFDKTSEALGNFFYLFDLLYQKIRTYLLRENQEKTMNDTYNPLARWYSKGRYDFFFTPPKLQQGLQFLENAPQETNKGPF